MTQDDFLLDQLEETQRHRTRRRRDRRGQRRRLLSLALLGIAVLLLLGLPSLICHTPVGRNLLIRAAAAEGLEANADSVRIGWVTPLRVTGLSLRGDRGGSEVTIDELTAGITVGDWIRSGTDKLGEVSLRGLDVRTDIDHDRFGLEEDFAAWLAPSDATAFAGGPIRLQDVTIRVRHRTDGRQWRCGQASAEVTFDRDGTHATYAGVLTDPEGNAGAVEGQVDFASTVDEPWRVEVQGESLPLAFVSLLRERFSEVTAGLPREFSGDATGRVVLFQGRDGAVEADLRGVEVRNLAASDPSWGDRSWNNRLATLEGDLILGDRIVGRRLRASADFAAVTLDGALARSGRSPGLIESPTSWLESLRGTATAQIDLAAFDAAMPGLIPLRDGVELVSGELTARVETDGEGEHRESRLAVRSDTIRARARGRAVAIEPVDVTATVRTDLGKITAEAFRWSSSFASAVGHGNPKSGAADVEVNFGRLAAMLRPLIDVSEADLGGTIQGNVRWSVGDENRWELAGEGTADDLRIALGEGRTLRRPKLTGSVNASGRWAGDSLAELGSVDLRIGGSGLEARTRLARPIRNPSFSNPIPLRLTAEGRLEELADAARPWLPTDLQEARGGFSLQGEGEISSATTRLRSLDAVLHEPNVVYQERGFAQPEVTLHFEGDVAYPAGDAIIRQLTVAGDAVSGAAQGRVSRESVDLEVAWRAKLERLQSSLGTRVAARPALASRPAPTSRPAPSIRTVSYRPEGSAADDRWWLLGDCDGNVRLRGDADSLEVETHAVAQNLRLLQPASAAAAPVAGPRIPTSRSGAGTDPRVVWAEPHITVEGGLRYDPVDGTLHTDSLQLLGDWFATTLRGGTGRGDGGEELQLQGRASVKTDKVADRLSGLAGTRIEAIGVHDTDLRLRATRGDDGNFGFAIDSTLGWEAVQVAGVRLGETTIPIRMTETSVSVAPAAVVPVDQGSLRLGGQVHYRPGPLWLQVRPGRIADSVRLTPEMTNRWLKFIAPLAADATRIDGTFSATLDEAIVVFDQPERSRVSGRLEIDGVEMASGPLTDRIIAGVEQIRAFRSLPNFNPSGPATRKLVSLPPQTVEFAVADNVVHHQRLRLEIDRAEVVTSGSVSLDGDLNVFAQVPLDPRWLGKDLEFLAGESITLPIRGTFERPTLDASAVGDLAVRVGSRAAQDATDRFLQDQIDRGQKQINRGIEKGFERLGLDKIFGN